MNETSSSQFKPEQVWRSYLTEGRLPEGLDLPWFESLNIRGLAHRIPSDPRCRVCHYPFGGFGGRLVRSLIHLQPSKMNPQLCNVCERFAEQNPGGAELEVTLLFADIRNSTPLAATMKASEYSRLIDRFYRVTTNIIYKHGGMVEKLVGDEVAAFFVPAFTEDGNHAKAAVDAAREILTETGHGVNQTPWVPLGLGVHTGEAFVGAVGEPGKNINITVLGDTVNVASRLGGQAATGEIVIGAETCRLAGLDKTSLEYRSLTLKGKDDPEDAWIYSAT
jgi:adenylate cyclase